MPAVEMPRRNRAVVSFASRPKRRWIAMKAMEPIGRAMKANAKMTKAYSVPSRPRSNGKNTLGNTSTEAMP
jgi:hypothetical protein